MPRAKRYHLPGHVWHITHRCHKGEFLFRFAKDRKCWIQWLFEAKKRYGLCVLNYMVTSNHIHLLVVDDQSDAISKSLQLVEGRTAQQYNLRKSRKGSFWSDRYHVTAIESGEHLIHCLVYIDLNMVRAGVISHPSEWPHCGYHEIQNSPERYRIVDHNRLASLCGIRDEERLKELHLEWTGGELKNQPIRQAKWTEAIAAGSESYIELVKQQLGLFVRKKQMVQEEAMLIREFDAAYSGHFDAKDFLLSPVNSVVYVEPPSVSMQ